MINERKCLILFKKNNSNDVIELVLLILIRVGWGLIEFILFFINFFNYCLYFEYFWLNVI